MKELIIQIKFRIRFILLLNYNFTVTKKNLFKRITRTNILCPYKHYNSNIDTSNFNLFCISIYRGTTVGIYFLSLVGMIAFTFTLKADILWIVYICAGALGYVWVWPLRKLCQKVTTIQSNLYIKHTERNLTIGRLWEVVLYIQLKFYALFTSGKQESAIFRQGYGKLLFIYSFV